MEIHFLLFILPGLDLLSEMISEDFEKGLKLYAGLFKTMCLICYVLHVLKYLFMENLSKETYGGNIFHA